MGIRGRQDPDGLGPAVSAFMRRSLLIGFVVVFLVLPLPGQISSAAPQDQPLQDSGVPLDANLLLVLNYDQLSANWKQLKGALKQRWGEFTDDDLLYMEGGFDKYEGKLQERYGSRIEEIKQWTDDWLTHHDEHRDPEKNSDTTGP